MTFEKIAIVGSGAVGLYYGGMLARSGKDVHFLLRSDFEAVQKDGIRLLLPDEEVHLDNVNAHRSAGSIGPADLILVCLKTTANEAIPTLLPPLLGDATAILTLQNGLGNEPLLAERFGEERVMGGLCFICLNRVGAGVVRNFFPGSLTLGEHSGPPGERARTVCDLFRAAGIDCHLSANLLETRWRKLVWNVPFNGLTIAAGGIDTQRILSDEFLTGEVKALMIEVQRTAAALGIAIEDQFLENQIEITRPMGPYRPSSLVDFLDKRPVEIQSIWEHPLRDAERLGVPSPRLRLLHALLRALC